jgi:predicted phage terminase large subunit-like protein
LTRWHEDDIVGRLLAAEDGHRWHVINIPALSDHDPNAGQRDALGRRPGQWLISARGRTDAEWEAIRMQVGTRVFAALYQGRPSPDTGDVWRRTWWRRYHNPLWSQHPQIPGAFQVRDCDELIMSWDMAFKDTRSSDFVVGQVWARRGADVYLLDQVRKRLSFTDTVTAFRALTARWPGCVTKLVEDKANGTAVVDTLRSKIPGIVPISPTESKYSRANAVAPMIESGNVLLPDPAIALFDTDELIEEAAAFPNGAHDDQVDAASQALARLLLDGTGAQAWIDWARRKAEAGAQPLAARDTPEAAHPGADGKVPALEPTDPVAARRAARNAAFRDQNRR